MNRHDHPVLTIRRACVQHPLRLVSEPCLSETQPNLLVIANQVVIEALLHSARATSHGGDAATRRAVERAVFEFAAALVAAGRVAVPTDTLMQLLQYLCARLSASSATRASAGTWLRPRGEESSPSDHGEDGELRSVAASDDRHQALMVEMIKGMVRSGLLRCENTDGGGGGGESTGTAAWGSSELTMKGSEVVPSEVVPSEVPWQWVLAQATAAEFWVVATLLHALAGQVEEALAAALRDPRHAFDWVSAVLTGGEAAAPSIDVEGAVLRGAAAAPVEVTD